MNERDKKIALLALAAAKAAKDRPAQKGDKGEQGEQGERGQDAVAINIEFIGQSEGKIVARLENGVVFEIADLEALRGERGKDGETIVGPAGQAGKDGKDGRSFKKLTQPSGDRLRIEFSDRTFEEFTLPAGAKGDRGERGERGADGVGIQGEKGEKGDKPAHEWEGTKLRFENPDGTWGQWVDLKGKDGKDGKDGKRGFVLNGSSSGGGTGGGGIESVVAGTGIEVDNSDPKNPVISATGGGAGNQEVFINEQPAINYPAISYTLIAGTNLYRQSINVVV